MTEVEEIPAGIPVVVEGYYYNKNVLTGAAAVGENDLVGAAEPVTADGTQYASGNIDGVEAFYKVNPGVVIHAGKAYICIDCGSAVKSFGIDLDGNATGIESIESGYIAPAVIYDFSGRRVNKVQKGIYVVGGKKVIFK